MGAGASVDHAVDAEEAKKIAGAKFDETKWGAAEKNDEGKVVATTWNAWVKEEAEATTPSPYM